MGRPILWNEIKDAYLVEQVKILYQQLFYGNAGIPQPLVSKYLKMLIDVELVQMESIGTHRLYFLNKTKCSLVQPRITAITKTRALKQVIKE